MKTKSDATQTIKPFDRERKSLFEGWLHKAKTNGTAANFRGRRERTNHDLLTVDAVKHKLATNRTKQTANLPTQQPQSGHPASKRSVSKNKFLITHKSVSQVKSGLEGASIFVGSGLSTLQANESDYEQITSETQPNSRRKETTKELRSTFDRSVQKQFRSARGSDKADSPQQRLEILDMSSRRATNIAQPWTPNSY